LLFADLFGKFNNLILIQCIIDFLNKGITGFLVRRRIRFMKKLGAEFYQRTNVVAIAKDLLGKLLVTNFPGGLTSGRIVEVEAYNGVADKASHAYNGRRTNRTENMYAAGGIAYVYLIYGIHSLFNVVTNLEGKPHAVLIRAIEPVKGIPVMLKRMQKENFDASIGRGPGNLSKALGISTIHTGMSLSGNKIYIASDDFVINRSSIVGGPRIGVDYAAEDALLPYRFYVRGNPHVSGRGNRT
jgi:DNA-3-methyladenine glycosylase